MAEEHAATEPEASAASAEKVPTTPSETPPPPSDQKWGGLSSRGRRITVRVIIGIATVLLVVGIFAVWANRQLLNPDNWSHTSTQLLQRAEIRNALSNYLVDQLYANVNVEQQLKSTLPSQLQPLAGPLSGAL